MTFFIIETVVKCVLIIAVFASLSGFATYVERKVLGGMHRRVGPHMVGPMGLIQVVADMIKLFTKEDVTPSTTDPVIWKIAPLISAIAAFVTLSVVPFFPEFTLFGHAFTPIVADVNVALLFIIGSSGIGFYAIVIGGISSNNKWSILGAARGLVAVISYEGVSALSLVAVVMLVGSLSLMDINAYQAGSVANWLICKQPLAFVLFTIAIFIEVNRTPLCLSENETELVAGFGTEYSALRWGMYFIGEYTSMFTGALLITLLFLGGYNSFWVIPGALMMLIKVCFVFFWYFWARGAWPQLRADQVMKLCYLVLLPLAVLNLLVTALILCM